MQNHKIFLIFIAAILTKILGMWAPNTPLEVKPSIKVTDPLANEIFAVTKIH